MTPRRVVNAREKDVILHRPRRRRRVCLVASFPRAHPRLSTASEAASVRERADSPVAAIGGLADASPPRRLCCWEVKSNSAEENTTAAADTSCCPPSVATSSCSFNSRKNSTSPRSKVSRLPPPSGAVSRSSRRFVDHVVTVWDIRKVYTSTNFTNPRGYPNPRRRPQAHCLPQMNRQRRLDLARRDARGVETLSVFALSFPSDCSVRSRSIPSDATARPVARKDSRDIIEGRPVRPDSRPARRSVSRRDEPS